MKSLICSVLALMALTTFAQKGVILTDKSADKKIEVSIDGKPFTTYYYPGPDVLKKAVLYPLLTANGTEITRGWPINPRPGERVDHPHHVGMWLNYESVNEHDFWNNSLAVNHEKHTYGTIVHTGITKMSSGKKQGELTVTANWLDKNGGLMLTETTTYFFRGDAKSRTVDRITTLTAQTNVTFKDVKDGMFAIRVARQLEHPSKVQQSLRMPTGLLPKFRHWTILVLREIIAAVRELKATMFGVHAVVGAIYGEKLVMKPSTLSSSTTPKTWVILLTGTPVVMGFLLPTL
jgi:Methane oxygenase PmoA